MRPEVRNSISRTARWHPDRRRSDRNLLRIRCTGIEEADDHGPSRLTFREYLLDWRPSDPSRGNAILIDREYRAIFQQREIPGS
jgi:hypothetical protein